MPVIGRTPYRNLILTGTIGTGKTGAGREIVQRMEGSQFIDVEIELQQREGYAPEQIRETFGEARLRSLESALVEEISLRRSTVIAISGVTLLDPVNRELLAETGPILCLTASLGEILRRLHVMQGGRFHDPEVRSIAVGRIKRESAVRELGLSTLDTTELEVDEVAQQAINFWMTHSDI